MTDYVELSLDQATLFYGTPYVDGRIGSPEAYADFTWPALTVAPDQFYALQFDVTAERDDAYLSVYSQNSAGDPDTSYWWSLGLSDPLTAGDHTVTVIVGPGMDGWNGAADMGENRLLIELEFGLYVRAARWRQVTTTYGPWMSDSDEVARVAYLKNTVSASTAGTTWSNTGFATWEPGANPGITKALNDAWKLAGGAESAPGGTGAYIGYGVVVAGREGFSWSVAWMTVDIPDVGTYAGTGTLPYDPFADPDVIGIEWREGPVDASKYEATIQLELNDDEVPKYNTAPPLIPVKYTNAMPPRYEPAPQPALAYLETPTLGYIQRVGEVWEPLVVDVTPGTIAISIPDPWTGSQTTAGLDDAAGLVRQHGWRVQVKAVYHPQYRLLYADTGTIEPAVTHAPPLRQWPRSDGLGMSSVRRVWPNTPSVQRSLRQGPGGYL